MGFIVYYSYYHLNGSELDILSKCKCPSADYLWYIIYWCTLRPLIIIGVHIEKNDNGLNSYIWMPSYWLKLIYCKWLI